MDCRYAYFKDGVPYVLCRKDKEPRTNRLDEITKCMCGYQRFCPNIRACALLPTWVECQKLKVPDESESKVIPAVTQKTTKRKKT